MASYGILLSLAAAAIFGVFAPAAKGALAHLEPVRAAGLTYVAAGGVALGALLLRALASRRVATGRVSRADLPLLAAMTLAGGVVGPLLFFHGVLRVAGHLTAIVQHLEFALTVVAAVLVLGERVGRRAFLGLLLVMAGLLSLPASAAAAAPSSPASSTGLILLAGACAAWAADNTLARRASDLDPLAVVSIKGIGGGSALLLLSSGSSWEIPARGWLLVLLAGGVGVGISLVLELLALRRIGAALNAGLFATGPAFGFLWSLLFLGERAGPLGWLALLSCSAGAIALATDRHAHRHHHQAIRHTHRHDHRDPHHRHSHDPEVDPDAPHVHEHEHPAATHDHPHAHDRHHRHRH